MRYPLAPLMQVSGIATMKSLRAIFPMNGTEYRRVIDDGLSEPQADRWAVKLGLHPAEVWPQWGHQACAAEDCGGWFLPPARAPHTRYCSPRCKNREKKRRYRATPNGAEANRRHRRAYYEENRGYELERRRRLRARGTSVEHSEPDVSPGHERISRSLATSSQADETVAA